MKKFYFSALIFALSASAIFAQQTQPSPQQRQTIQAAGQPFDLTQYGVRIQPDQRLIIVMAALEAAGFDSKNDSLFRQQLRKDLETLDPDLRRRMREFFTRANKNLETATPTDQAARYVSLAYALTPAPDLSEPARSPDLPAGLLEVLDFAPLVREFYRKSGIAEKLPEYTRKYQAIGDSFRPNVARAIGDVTGYLNTRPQLTIVQRVTTTNKDTSAKKDKKPTLQSVEVKERERNFYVVPDLLAVPNSVRFRIIGDDYFAIIGSEVQPEKSSEIRRAYLQFLIDPLVYKNAKEIGAQREAIRGLLEEQIKAGANVSPDPFFAVARSFVAAADVRQRKQARIEHATLVARQKIDKNKPVSTSGNAKSVQITDEVWVENNRLTFPKAEAEAFAELSEAYESGAVLAFFFDEQLRGIESAGFDVTGSFADIILSFDAGKEKARLKENQAARKQAVADLAKRRQENAAKQIVENDSASQIRNNELIKGLNDVEQMLKTQDFEQAENFLKEMLLKFPGEPRILYALGRTASLSANNVFDEGLRDERLKKAAAHYLSVLQVKNEDTPKALISNTHVALGKIYEFYEDAAEENKAAFKAAALKQFDAAIALGNVPNGSYAEAVARKERLMKKQ